MEQIVRCKNKVVSVLRMNGGLRAVEEGLKPGDRVIVNGLQRVRPGVEVKSKSVDMTKLRAGSEDAGSGRRRSVWIWTRRRILRRIVRRRYGRVEVIRADNRLDGKVGEAERVAFPA